MPTPPTAPRLFLVDGYALIYRAFFALITRPLTTSRGENTSAAWGIANFLQRLLTQHRPEYLGWVHDAGTSFRHETYPEYKATREKLTDELQADFDRGMERIGELLRAYDIPILAKKGYEADDVIGSLAKKGVEAGLNVVIVSGDKDFQQLVRPGVWLLNPGRGGPASVEEQWVSVENATERLGVAPEFVTDYLALVGDTSDNVPGVPGIGDKTAVELVKQFGHLESMLGQVETITKKRPREALLANADKARLSKELVTIHCDVDLPLELEKLRLSRPNVARLRELYVELEFHSMARAVQGAEAAAGEEEGDGDTSFFPAPKDDGPPLRYETVDTVERLREVVARVREVGSMAVDTETTTDPSAPSKIDALRSNLISISIAVAPGEAYYLPLRHREREPAQGELLAGGTSLAAKALAAGAEPVRNLPPLTDPAMRPLVELLEDPAIPKTAQNAKYDWLVLRRAGLRPQGLAVDTMLASYVLDPGRRSNALDLLALEVFGHSMISYEDLTGKGKSQLPFDEVPIGAARDYSCEDADMTLRLRDHFLPRLEEAKQLALYREIEVPLVEVLVEMEEAGVAIDLAWFRSLKERFARERARVEKEIHDAAGEEFNINSNPRLRSILFEKLQLPVLKKTATGPSTDATVLQQLAEEGHTLPALLMEYREISKLESTYIDALPALVNPETKRIHTSYNQTVAATGRLSSSDPNLQNIPIRRELGRDIRRGFVPRKGWRFLAADYSQIELRLLAHLSHDPAFVEAFRAGGDIHRQTGAIIFGVDVKDVTSGMRARAKTINFATIYGQGPHALSRQLKIDFAEARLFISTYFERFKGIRLYLDSMVELAREQGYVETIFGRRRFIPEIRDRNFNVRAFGERTATNSPIQGSAADLIKIAMIRIARRLHEEKLESRMLLQVHDELVFETPAAEVDTLRALVKHEMEHAAELSVPLVVEVGTGTNWLDTKMG